MTGIVHIGPLALAADRLIALAAILLFLVIGSRENWFGKRADRTAWAVMLAGLLFARIGYVVVHFDAFRIDPIAIFKVWEGGFRIDWGIAAAAVVAIWKSKGAARLRFLFLIALVAAASLLTLEALRRPPPPLPTVLLTDMEGRGLAFPANMEGPAVINLWASWCGPCRAEMPLLRDMAAEREDVRFHFINMAEEPEQARQFARSVGLDDEDLLIDPAAQLAETYGGALPTTIFVAADGSVHSVHSGAISRAALSEGLAAIGEEAR
ncbi:TlpA disulfide reductase family protein [Sphingomicrobium lutaoense]|uniref:Thiol-disulfide isomerase/thioredoxin n=1 Tax=Sphingomicrobium lutaoense TaxID=515949 RepID=A0A839Z142_9SPHN|nr:TlpA disulfide reductase family protein [Sphingomicrobium lutaoense]MBB3763403.1 thiol-disulfide isomerase/thioredoxin [Sphingomicrobium lutaoense]